MKSGIGNSGVSIIAAMLAMLILAVFMAVVVSFLTTGSNVGLQEEQGVQAFYIAEGGLEKAIKYLQDGGKCEDISGSASFTNVQLGAGRFTVTATRYRPVPGARLLNNIDAAVTSVPSNAVSLAAAGYAPSGRIAIQNDPPPGMEMIDYGALSGSSFVNCTRGADGTVAAAHAANRRIIQNQCDVVSLGTIQSSFVAAIQRRTQVSLQQ